MSAVAENLRKIRERVARAAECSGRTAEQVSVIAISKTFPVEAIAEAIAAGQVRFGENRVQEAGPKIRSLAGPHPLEWHLVGHLQTNKARQAAELFQVVHSVDSADLASRLSDSCRLAGKTLSVLIQIDLGKEETKFGIDEHDVRDLITAISALEGLRIDGLMTMPPYFEDPERARPFFRRLRELRDSLQKERPGCLGIGHLSMGMSHDFEMAIEEGATMVRIGTAIFGPRNHG